MIMADHRPGGVLIDGIKSDLDAVLNALGTDKLNLRATGVEARPQRVTVLRDILQIFFAGIGYKQGYSNWSQSESVERDTSNANLE